MIHAAGVRLNKYKTRVIFDWQDHPDDIISLHPGRQNVSVFTPYQTNLTFPVFSIFKGFSSEHLTVAIKAIKGQNKDIDVYGEDLFKMLKKGAIFIQKYLHPDIILLVPSSSHLTQDFVAVLKDQMSSPEVIYHELTVLGKNRPDQITVSPEATPVAKDIIERLRDEAMHSQSWEFPVKRVPVQYRKWIHNLFKLTIPASKFVDKSVLVVDDVLTTGTSFNSVFQILSTANPKEVTGLALIRVS